jgi:Tfp pilus assembly protein PilO
MTNNPKPGSWILLLSMVGVSVVYLLAVFFPTQKAIGRLNDEARQKEAYCAQAGNLDTILKATRVELEKTRQYNKTWSDATPSQGQVVALLGHINALSRVAGAETTRFDPEPIVRLDRICKIPLTMGLTGPLPQIFDFVADLEGLPQSIWIENVILEKIENIDKASGSVSCEIKLAIFDDNSNISDQGNPTH